MDEQVSPRKARILLAVGILAVLLVGVGGPLLTAHVEQLAKPVIVQGTVSNRSGHPLAGINVQVYRRANNQWEAINAVDTNDHGFYRFAGLKSGRYTVAFQDDSGVGYLASGWGGGLTAHSAKYRVLAGGQVGTFDDRIVLGAAITGHATVTDPDRGTIDATQFDVNAYPVTPKPGGGYSIHLTQSISSLEPVIGGNWRIQNLRSGSYVLQAVDDDEYPAKDATLSSRWIGIPATAPYSLHQWPKATIFTVVAGKVYRSAGVNLAYAASDPQPALVLKIQDEAGHPIAGASINLTLLGGDQSTFESGVHRAPFTDKAGSVGVYRATPGTYYLTVLKHGYAPFTETLRYRQGESGSMTVIVKLAAT